MNYFVSLATVPKTSSSLDGVVEILWLVLAYATNFGYSKIRLFVILFMSLQQIFFDGFDQLFFEGIAGLLSVADNQALSY